MSNTTDSAPAQDRTDAGDPDFQVTASHGSLRVHLGRGLVPAFRDPEFRAGVLRGVRDGLEFLCARFVEPQDEVTDEQLQQAEETGVSDASIDLAARRLHELLAVLHCVDLADDSASARMLLDAYLAGYARGHRERVIRQKSGAASRGESDPEGGN